MSDRKISATKVWLITGSTRGFVYLILLAALAGITIQAQHSPVKNVVLVHGAWADGSGWKGVYDILVKDG